MIEWYRRTVGIGNLKNSLYIIPSGISPVAFVKQVQYYLPCSVCLQQKNQASIMSQGCQST
jgi:hypothetical protein